MILTRLTKAKNVKIGDYLYARTEGGNEILTEVTDIKFYESIKISPDTRTRPMYVFYDNAYNVIGCYSNENYKIDIAYTLKSVLKQL